MKIRQGFVSNSSSSSFVIGVPQGSNLSKNKILDLLKVPSDSVLYDMANDVAEFIIDRSNKVDKESLLADYGYDTFDEMINNDVMEAKLFVDGYDVYTFYASDQDGGIEATLCNMTIDFDSDEFVIHNRGY